MRANAMQSNGKQTSRDYFVGANHKHNARMDDTQGWMIPTIVRRRR